MYTLVPTIIQYLLAETVVSSLTTQIAAKQLYGESWSQGTLGIVVSNSASGGQLNDLPVNLERVSITVYAGNIDSAMATFEAIRKVLRAVDRVTVTFPDASKKYLYFAVPTSGPSNGWNPEINMDFTLGFFQAMGHEEAL